MDDQPPQDAPRRARRNDRAQAEPRGPLAWMMAHRLRITVLAAIVLLGVPFALDVLALEPAFTAVEASLDHVQAALVDTNLDEAREAAAEAVVTADAAAGRVDGPAWWALSKVPWLGASAEVGRAAGALAQASARAAMVVTTDGEILFDEDGTRLGMKVADGKVDLEILGQAAAVLDKVPLAELKDAVARLAATEGGYVPSLVAKQRTRALATAREALDQVETATLATNVLPGFLGGDGTRRYLLGLENPAEIRATGGFLGFVGVLEADHGQLRLIKAEDVDPLSEFALTDESFRRILSVSNPGDPPVDAPADFAARYDAVAGRSWIPNVNTHPSLPTIAPILLDLWERQVGERLDGVMLVDPITLEKVLELTGPLDIPDEWAHPDLPDPIPADQLLKGALIGAYDAWGGPTVERKNYHAVVANAAFARMFGGAWEPGPMLQVLGEAAAGRHLMINVVDPLEQQLFERIGADGYWGPDPEGGLLLGVSANNASADKADLEMRYELDVRVDVTDVDEASMTAVADVSITVTMRNELDPTGRDDYITRSSYPQRVGEERVDGDELGLSRTWFTAWTDEASAFRGAFDETGGLLPAGQFTIDGMRAIDHDLEVGLDEQASFEVRYQQRLPLVATPDGLGFRFRWMPPTSATPTTATLALRTPYRGEAAEQMALSIEPATMMLMASRR